MYRLNVDKIFLAFVFLIPLMPRPTALGPEKWVVPCALLGLILAWYFSLHKNGPAREGKLQLLGFIIGFPMLAYVTRAVAQGGLYHEWRLIVSRLLFSVGLFAMTHWLCSTNVPKKTIFKAFVYGFLLTALLTIFCGITGIQILEEDSIKPSRYFGFYKSTGIFRSFGEFGIMGCIPLAYLVIFARDFRPANWIICMAVVVLAILISQSRNVYLTCAVTFASLFLFSRVQLPKIVVATIAALLILIPFAVETSLPLLKQSAVGSTLIGTGSNLEGNVRVRFTQLDEGLKMISNDFVGGLTGFPRPEWNELMIQSHGFTIAPHNHFLSNILFLGILGGGVWIWGLYILPGIKISQAADYQDPIKLLALVSLFGNIVGLSFYEGFFSVVVMMIVAMAWSVAYSYAPAMSDGPATASFQPFTHDHNSEYLTGNYLPPNRTHLTKYDGN